MNTRDNQQPSSDLETHRICRICCIQKPILDFQAYKKGALRRRTCRECERLKNNARHDRWRENNRDHVRHSNYVNEKRHLEQLTPEQRKARNARIARWAVEKREQLKATIYAAYGGYICACCGETEPKFLSLDHVNNDGYKLRKAGEHTRGGTTFYRWIVEQGCPPGLFQILCMNCNFGKSRNGGVCPHQTEKVQRLSGNGVEPSGSKRPALFCEEVMI